MRLETVFYLFSIICVLLLSRQCYALEPYFRGTFNQGLMKAKENTEPMPIYPITDPNLEEPLAEVTYQGLTSLTSALMGIEFHYHQLILGAGLELGVLSREVIGTVPKQMFIQGLADSSQLYLANIRLGLQLDKTHTLLISPEAGLARSSVYHYQSLYLPMTVVEASDSETTLTPAFGIGIGLEQDTSNYSYYLRLRYLTMGVANIDVQRFMLPIHLRTHEQGMTQLTAGIVL